MIEPASLGDEQALGAFARQTPLTTPRTPSPRAGALVGIVGPQLQAKFELRAALAAVQMRCVWLPNAEQALGAATQAVFDALLIDASETEADAQMLAGLRAVFRCPLVVLASQVNDIDEIIALEAGADAYLLRSSPARLLRARLTALLRQHRHRPPGAPSQAALLEYAGWHLDRVTNALTRHGQVLDLSEAQGAMLQCLMWARGAIVSRERLASSIHHAPRVGLRSIDVYVHRLRKRLASPFDTGLLIESERRRGYRLSSAAPGFDTAR